MNSIQEKLKLKFDDSFFCDEIRCGYNVTSITKKIWAVQIDLLNELLMICEKYDIEVLAYAGTLLGAVRHGGFIPWDDDIDVCMDRENYNKLLEHIDDFKHPYFLQTAYNDSEFFIGYARLRNSLTTGVVAWEKSVHYNCGIFIDIFVLDGYIEDDFLLRKQIKNRKRIEKIIDLYKWSSYSGIKRLIKRTLKFIFLRKRSYEDVVKEYVDCVSLYTNDTNRITLMTHNENLLRKYWCNKDDLNSIKYVPFENIVIPIPEKYDSILRNMYGNYLEYPAVEKRGQWHKDIIYFDPDISYKEYFEKIYESKK